MQTGEGELFDVDMRLRPDGQKAPLAVSREGFENYHRDNAWTWEKMALTRARAIAGPTRLQADLADFIRADLAQPRDGDALLRDIADMRRVAREQSAIGPWDARIDAAACWISSSSPNTCCCCAHASPRSWTGTPPRP